MGAGQIILSIAGMITAQTGIILTVLILYINAKVDARASSTDSRIEGMSVKLDSVKDQVDLLVQYLISHEGKISRLEERTKD